jgi:hypothetical protein
VEAEMQAAERAMQAQNYEQAAATVIQSQLRGAKGADAKAAQYNRMRQLQIQLARRLASNPNDPAAQKAAQMLQAAQAYQMQGGGQ